MKFTSRDGLIQSNDPEIIAHMDDFISRREDDKRSWADRLRAMGVKFAAPDDGWVHRKPDGSGYASVSWYPLFDDKPEPGDLIAFGCPPSGAYGVEHYVPRIDHDRAWKGRFDVPKGEIESACQGYRLARVTKVERSTGPIWWAHYHYEDTGIRIPPIPPLWQRLRARARRRFTHG